MYSKVDVNKDVGIPINAVPWNLRNLFLPSIYFILSFCYVDMLIVVSNNITCIIALGSVALKGVTKLEPQGALIAHLSTMSTSVLS